MSFSEEALLFSALFVYFLLFTILCFRKESKVPIWLLLAGLALHLASALIRWVGIGHPPIFGTYEAALQGSWFIALYVAFSYRSVHGHFRAVALTAIPMTVLIILYGLSFNTDRIPLTISEKSLWVDFHALFSWLAYAPFTLAFCLSLSYLWRERNVEKITDEAADTTFSREEVEATRIPQSEIVDELSFRYINFGFINHTIMFALGCYYSSILYGTWWQWDPAESTSLITWLSVALYIHMRLFYNWRGKRAAWLFVVIFLVVIFSYWGLLYLPAGSTFHVFDLELKAHTD